MTRKILSYSLFEGKTEDYKIEEFKKALDSPEGKDFQRWFDIEYVRTGRGYIHRKDGVKGISIPSRSYFDFNGNLGTLIRGEWYYEFASSNGAYGTTYDEDLKSLFRIFMVDAVRKSRPSSVTEKKIKEFFSVDSNFPKGDFPDPEKIYSSIIGESGFITDLSFLMDLPIIKRLLDLGIPVYAEDKKGITSITIDFKNALATTYSIIEKIFGKKYSDSLREIIENIPKNENSWAIPEIVFFEYCKPIEIMPRTSPGKTVSDTRSAISLRFGFDTKEKIEKIVEDFIKERVNLINSAIKQSWFDRIYIDPLTEYIKKKILGESIEGLEEESKERIDEILLGLIGPGIEKNPLDIYLADGLPSLKEKIMKKYGIEKDFSKLGKAFGKGFL